MKRLLFFVFACLTTVMVKSQVAGGQLDSVISSLNLKEVVVKAKKVRQQGDTIIRLLPIS